MTGPGSGEVRIPVLVVPRGGRDAIEGVRDGRLRIRVAAAPVDGAANEALVRIVAASLGLPRSAVRVASGGGSRRKVVAVAGATRDSIAARWPDLGV